MTHSKLFLILLMGAFAVSAPLSSAAMAQQGPGMDTGMGPGMGMHGGMHGMGFGMGMGGMGMGGMGMGGMHPGFSMHHSWFGPGMAGCFMMAGDPAMLAQKLNALRDALSLSATQASQWDAFANAVMRSHETMQAAYQTMMSNMMNMNFAERFTKQLEAMNLHMAEMQKVSPALVALYGALTPDQKARAEAQFHALGCAI